MSFKGYLAVITGAATGIGKALALKAASEGIHLALIDINNESLQVLQTQLSSQYPSLKIYSFYCDVSKFENVMKIADEIKKKFKTNSIQMLFNNVGISSLNVTLIDGNLSFLHKLMDVNVWSIIYNIRCFLPLMLHEENVIANKDVFIVNTGSIASVQTADSFYSVTKHAVLAISETLHKELQNLFKLDPKYKRKRNNVFVSTLCPGYVETDLFTTTIKSFKEEDNNFNGEEIINLKNAKTNIPNSSFPNFQLVQKVALQPSTVAEKCFQGLRDKKFIIYTHESWTEPLVQDRMSSLLNGIPNDSQHFKQVFKNLLNNNNNNISSKL